MNQVIYRLKRVMARMEQAELIFLTVCTALLVMVSGWGVFSRYVLSRPLAWPEETGIFLYIWMSFVGASTVYRRKSHIAISFLVDRFPVALARVVNIFVYVIIGLFFLLIIHQGARLMPMQSTIQVGAAIRMPKHYFTLSLWLSAISMSISNFCFLLEEIQAFLPARKSSDDAAVGT